jgi:threonine synthase
LLHEGFLKTTDKVVIFNTGSGLKYIDVVAEALNISVSAPGCERSLMKSPSLAR